MGIVWTQLISDIITAIVSYIVYHSSIKKLNLDMKNS